jgi:soluble lytic murein transglycosylase-like protein
VQATTTTEKAADVFDEIVSKYSAQFNVPEWVIQGVIMTESSGRPDVISADGGYGLMQLMPATASGLGYTGALSGLLDPETNIMLGTKLLGQLRARYGDDWAAVYSAYNSGSGTNYLTNSTVAAHVNNFLRNLESVIANTPVIASTGALAGLIGLVVVWWWTKGKRK